MPVAETASTFNEVHLGEYALKQATEEEKLNLSFRKVGDYMTAIDMEGLSLTLVKLEDAKWLDYLNAPVDVISW